ncbi:MAG: DUF4367 domain-containing protein [Oscillospiraceae bacterium]|nr:DUF4367 domain-containing protein [Oscillospiraceae bacterium]
MSENQIRGTDDLSYCDTMTTEELEEILRLDAKMPEGQESDTDKILYIMEVLAERKRNTSHTGKTALEAYESFKQNYMPKTDDNIIPIKTRRRLPRWVRGLVATAAVLAILFTGSVTAKAFGFNIWKAVIQWTQETFHFGDWGNSDTDNNIPYSSLQEALEKGNVPSKLVPTWIPEGYKLVDVTAERTPVKRIYKAKYLNAEKELIITVCDHIKQSPVYVEQGEGLTEEYETSGIIYHIFTDVDITKAKWIRDSYECSISGNITIEELKMMIDSIEKG